jgi:hypothetical protein
MDSKMALHIPTFIGLLGVTFTLLAYALLQTERLRAETVCYCLLNILGSVLILYSLCFDWNFSAFIMEGMWLIFSIYGLWRVARHHRRAKL